MADRSQGDYEPVFSAKAMDTFMALSKARQRRIAKIACQLATQPLPKPDYLTQDATGRFLSNIRVGGYLFTFWVDGSPMELRIVDLVEL